MIWRIFTHMCRFKHNVDPAEWLLDKACLTPHEHGFDPNPLCKFEVRVASKKTIDFKLIKQITLEALTQLGEVIEKEEEDQLGFLLTPAYYDFGTITTEALLDDLKKLLFVKLNELKAEPIRVQVYLNETRKYAVWDDGNLLQSDLEE